MTFGYDIEKIARIKAEKGLTNMALAMAAGVHPATVTNVLSGRCGTPTTFAKLAAALAVDLADLTIPIGEDIETPRAAALATRGAGAETACGVARRGRASSEGLR